MRGNAATRHEGAPRGGGEHRYVVFVAAVAALGGLLFGYDTGVIGGALLFVTDDFALSPFLQGVVVSFLLVGAVVGALVGGPLSDRIGRRRLMLAAAVVFVLGAVAAALAPNAAVLVLARFVLGLGVGVGSLVVPLYISEMAPAEVRGALVTLNNLMITVGITLSFLAGYALAPVEGWRWMFALATLPALILGMGMLLLPESPRWLFKRGRIGEARAVLSRTRHEAAVEAEIREIQEIERLSSERAGFGELLAPYVRPALVVGVGLAVFQQVTGINTVIYYAPTILESTGLGAASSILATFGVGLMLVAMSIVAIVLLDRVGRRPLLLWGLVGMAVSLALLGAAFALPGLSGLVSIAATVCLALFVGSFAVSLGPVFWLMISEIYPLRIRGTAASVATMANWGSNFAVSLTFPLLLATLGATTSFWFYGVICVLAWVFSYFLVPETKGRSLEEIEADLRRSVVAVPETGEGRREIVAEFRADD